MAALEVVGDPQLLRPPTLEVIPTPKTESWDPGVLLLLVFSERWPLTTRTRARRFDEKARTSPRGPCRKFVYALNLSLS